MNGCANKFVRAPQVNKLFSAYCTLISSPLQLAQCQEAKSLSELLEIIKHIWNCPEFSDNQLLAELSQLNQQIIDSDAIQLAGHWLPYRYHAKSCSIYWCLPSGHATEPFQDEYISRCRQQSLLNNIIQPRTPLKNLSFQANKVANVQPAGFIFHLSRCGSTLISGCLSELDSTCVFSESPILTEMLLDPDLPAAVQQEYLQQLIDLQAYAFPTRTKVVIKWNAWDIFRWDLIRAIYSQVPVIFLVRDPVEILASHHRSAGRHMSGDPTLGHLHSVFDKKRALSLLEFRVDVLLELLSEMQSIAKRDSILRLDYRQLNSHKLSEICAYFHIPISQQEIERIKTRLAFHSKSPAQSFHDDTTAKQNLFSANDIAEIQKSLTPAYSRFIESN